MKKTWISLTISLIVVLALSFVGGKFLLPFIMSRSYSQTTCLTDQVSESMDVYDIAKLYRDNRATVAVLVSGENIQDGYEQYTSLGSGVCVASKGYTTSSLDTNYTASRGSYVVTNYHVIDMLYSSDFTNCEILIMPEEEETFACQLIWSNKDLDVAVLYCDTTNLNYVAMEDRSIFAEENKLDIEEIFTIGTPLDLSYINRFTKGEVASNNAMYLPNAEYIYPYSSGGTMKYSHYPVGTSSPIMVLSNMYEDVVDITVGITNGNSGGGVFDTNGVLVGLTTLGLGVDSTGGNQMNGMVPIYPIIEVIDKLISNNEQSTTHTIYTLESIGIKGIDAYEAAYADYFQAYTEYQYYFLDGAFYSSTAYYDDFGFASEGYYILSNSATNALGDLGRGTVLNSCTINGNSTIKIVDRNDLIYALLQIDDGDSVTFSYPGTFGLTATKTVQF